MAVRVFDGIARKVAPGFLVLSFVGWILFVAGFAREIKEIQDFDPDYEPKQNYLYPYWAGSVLGPIVFLLAVTHALLWGFPSAIVGSITAVLSMMYITAVSFVMVANGLSIRNPDEFGGPDTPTKLMFAGGFITTVFWTGVLALWPWYKIDKEGPFSGF